MLLDIKQNIIELKMNATKCTKVIKLFATFSILISSNAMALSSTANCSLYNNTNSSECTSYYETNGAAVYNCQWNSSNSTCAPS